MDSRLRGNDGVANAVFYNKNREHQKSTYKQQMHPGKDAGVFFTLNNLPN